MRACLKLFPNDENKEKGSIYTIDMAQQADLLAAGSTDAVVRIFDMRQGKKIMKLKVSPELLQVHYPLGDC